MEKELKILIIDDDLIDIKTISKSISKSGISAKVVSAFSAVEGIDKLEGNDFNLLFLDYMMPDTDGISFLKKVRQLGFDIPVIFITSQGDEKIASQAILEGASDYIPKTLLTADGISQSIRNAIKLQESIKRRRETEIALEINSKRLVEAQRLAKIGTWELDTKTGISFFSDEFFNVTEIEEKDNFSFEKFKNLFDDECKQKFDEVLTKIKSDIKEIQFDHAFTNSQGGKRYFTEYLKPLFDENGKLIRILGTIQDITKQKEIEAELIHAKNIAELSVRTKEQFLANMSHEIRTPMNGIIGFAKILENSVLDAEQKQCVTSIATAGENLMIIINDILDFSKIEADKMTFEKTDFSLSKTVNSVIDLFIPKAKDKNLKLVHYIRPHINDALLGDPTRLSQILINLIGNSLKFTEKGAVELMVTQENESESETTLIFSIIDTGIGIAAHKIDSIFESFKQESNDTTRKYGGTGLGLTITKKLIELQGGSLSVRSEVSKGTEFSFKITYAIGNEENQKSKVEIVTDLSPDFLKDKNILLVEDNDINQLLATKVFKQWGKTIDIAENGKIAIDQIIKNDYDVVLMDIQMPEMDGNEATIYIRENLGAKANIPIIALTAHATLGEEKKCLDYGMNDYLSKPFDAKVLLEKLYQNVKSGYKKEIDSTQEKIIDLSYLRFTSDNDKEFMEELIGLYKKNIPIAIQKIKLFCKENDVENLNKEVHKLSSSIGLLGLKTAISIITEIEHKNENKEPLSDWMVIVEDLITICERSLVEVETIEL
jgi:signal transduction histidine kinase/CheY-like chemotaxis protein/HPt (histidine-containing phosphotransfer) domain-containing protein